MSYRVLHCPCSTLWVRRRGTNCSAIHNRLAPMLLARCTGLIPIMPMPVGIWDAYKYPKVLFTSQPATAHRIVQCLSNVYAVNRLDKALWNSKLLFFSSPETFSTCALVTCLALTAHGPMLQPSYKKRATAGPAIEVWSYALPCHDIIDAAGYLHL